MIPKGKAEEYREYATGLSDSDLIGEIMFAHKALQNKLRGNVKLFDLSQAESILLTTIFARHFPEEFGDQIALMMENNA